MIRMASNFIKLAVLIAFLSISFAAPAAEEQPQGQDIEETMSDVLRLEKPSGDFGRYLELIFGGFIFENLEGESGDPTYDQLVQEQTVLAEAIGFVNILAIFLGVVVTAYTMIAGSLMTAYSGEVLGRSWSTYWLPVRSALGFGLLLPVKAIGAGTFSTAQLAALYLVMIGSNAGDYIWEYSVEKVVGGAPIVSAPKHIRVDATNKRLKALTCAAALYDLRAESNGVDPEENYLFSYEVDGTVHKYYNSLKPGAFSFLRGKKELENISFGYEGKCGVQEFGSEIGDYTKEGKELVGAAGNTPENSYEVMAATAGKVATVNAVVENLNGLTPAALAIIADVGEPVGPLRGVYGSQGMARAFIENDKEVIGYIKNIAAYVSAEAISYSNNISTEVSEATTQNPEVRDRFTKRLTTLGWTGSYIWFHEVPKFQSISHNLINNLDSNMTEADSIDTCNGWTTSSWYTIRFSQDDLEAVCNGKDFKSIVTGTNQITSMAAREVSGNTRDMTSIDATTLAANCTKDSCENPEEIFTSVSSSIVMAMFSVLDYDPIGTIRENDFRGTGTQQTSGLANPFATSTALGHNLKRIQSFGFVALVASGAAAKGVSDSVVGLVGGGVLDGIFTAILLPLQMALGMLAINAMTLGYVLPLIPVLTGISLVLSYLIKVIEAVVATPLAIVQMLMPEGEGIMGTRLERSMQILATIILTPSLLVIGVIAAITMSFIGFAILNSMFWKMASLTTGASVWEALTLVSLYTLSLIFIIKKSVAVMATLPDSILNWFSGSMGGAFGDSAQAVESSGSEMDKGMAGMAPDAEKGLLSRKARRESAKANRNQTDETS